MPAVSFGYDRTMKCDTDLAHRVCALERSLRRARLACLAGGASLLAVALIAARPHPGADPVTASEFRLVDAKGDLRGTFALEGGEHPTLAILDPEGRKRWQVLLKDNEVYSYMRDGEGHGRITHAIDRANHPHFLVHDKGNKPRIHMAVADSGAPSLIFIHQDGTMPSGLGVHADGRPWVLPERALPEPAGKAEPTEPSGTGKK